MWSEKGEWKEGITKAKFPFDMKLDKRSAQLDFVKLAVASCSCLHCGKMIWKKVLEYGEPFCRNSCKRRYRARAKKELVEKAVYKKTENDHRKSAHEFHHLYENYITQSAFDSEGPVLLHDSEVLKFAEEVQTVQNALNDEYNPTQP